MSRNTGGTLDPVTGVHDTAWIAEPMGDAKRLPEQRCAERPIRSSMTSSAKLSREEPDASVAHVRVCGGRGGQPPRLPGDLNPANLLTKWHWIVELARKKPGIVLTSIRIRTHTCVKSVTSES